MISKAKIKQLENKCNQVANNGASPLVIRYVSQDRKLLDGNGYLLTEDEIETIERENEEIKNQNGLIIGLKTYCKYKKRQ